MTTIAPSKERPILFSGSMVRAILDGRKTQTRRICKTRTQNQTDIMATALMDDLAGADDGRFEKDAWNLFHCPYGGPGDRLWVRENFRLLSKMDGVSPSNTVDSLRWYEADGIPPVHNLRYGKLRPSIHMPRWASRILLEIVSVRVEHLQDISDADVFAEGIRGVQVIPDHLPQNLQGAYGALWESINGAGTWDANPFVWVIEFKRILP